MSVLDLSSIEFQTSDGRLLFQTAAARFNSGEFTVISGQMAAGKTCLAKLLAGLQACTKGQISCDGRLLRRSTDFRKARIRLSHQNPASQIIGHTVLEELSLGRDSTFALPWLEWAELNERADSDPRDLAFGEQRRLALAIALAEEPTFLLLDDPFLGLDQAFVPKLLRCLVERHQAGKGVLLFSNDIEKVLAHADRQVLLKQGRVIADALPERVLPYLDAHGFRKPTMKLAEMSWLKD